MNSDLGGASPEVQRKERDWQNLHDAIVAAMDQYGKRSFYRDGDYDLQDISAELSFQSVMIKTPRLLRTDIFQ